MSVDPAAAGQLAFVLHAHLPFVRHPEHEEFLEEDWLYEAITETYIPLLRLLDGWVDDGVEYRLALSITPPLMSMLADDLLQRRYARRLQRLLDLGAAELRRTRGRPEQAVARHYVAELEAARAVWERLHGRLLDGFAAHAATGRLDLLTSGATHGYLPLLRAEPVAVWAQLAVGVQCYERQLGRRPQGIWLPECGYYPGLDERLAELGLRYFVLDAHGLDHARPRPRRGVHAPVLCPGSQVVAFARDLQTARQVWSRDEGYPGDPAYREFYRDIGYDLDLSYVGPWVQPDGGRKNTGFKYHRITGPEADKAPYDVDRARQRVAAHAEHFVAARRTQLTALGASTGEDAPLGPPLVVAAYDAELFGHWWYEGPWWLDRVVRLVAAGGTGVALTHLAAHLTEHPTVQLAAPAESSWGDRGYHAHWCTPANAWIYPALHRAASRMVAAARRWPAADGLRRRALTQAARELLLAQSSDWAFILQTNTMAPYARRRTEEHLARFDRLLQLAEAGGGDEAWLSDLEATDNLFAELDYRVYGRHLG